MSNLKDFMKNVKMPDIAPKTSSNKQVNLKTLKKELEERMNEKAKIYGFIGMEVYDLSKEGKIEVPQISSYLQKMDELNVMIEDMEKEIKEQEIRNQGKNICSCGYKLKAQDRFCPNCGEMVSRDTIICTCGAELSKNSKFCNVCGKKVEEIIEEQEKSRQVPMKECICGAKIPAGQFMCLECGRKVE